MRGLLQLAWDTLLFRHEAYAQHAARADVLKRGLTLLVLVTLLGGLVSLAIDIARDLRPTSIAAQRREIERSIRELTKSWRPLRQYFDLPPDLEEQVLRYARAGMKIGFDIQALPTRLPKPVGRVLEDVGAFLSLPFRRLAGWIGYGIWVLLVAKLLGGKATLPRMLGTTALYAVPHILGIFGFVPCLGGTLGLVATVWGVAIYAKAVAVANDFSIGRAIAATVMPALVGAGLMLLGSFVFFVLALLSA